MVFKRALSRASEKEQQATQMAAIMAIRNEATQEQENQVFEQLIRTERSLLPVNYPGLKASKRKMIDEDNFACGEFLISNVIEPSLKKVKISPTPAGPQVEQCPTQECQKAKKGNEFAPARKGPRSKIKPVYTHREVVNTSQRPDWYNDINANGKHNRGDLQSLAHTKTIMKNCVDAYHRGEQASLENHLSRLAKKLHEMEFYPCLSENPLFLVMKSKLLDSGGLFDIFKGPDAHVFPWYIRADAEALYSRWLVQDFDPSLFRGIKSVKGIIEGGKKRLNHSLDKDYKHKRSANVVGDNGLVNGQWFASRVCAMRDGAHGEIEAGIHGKLGKGAYSLVVAQGGYADKDHGETIEYCGTESTTSTPTKGTSLLQQSFVKGQPVRVLRAANNKSKYAPKQGVRFDGMYQIVGKEVLNPSTAMFRFSLKRLEGQDPIRYQNEKARPTEQELNELKKIKSLFA